MIQQYLSDETHIFKYLVSKLVLYNYLLQRMCTAVIK